jgi:hypothetical protein
MERKPSPLIFDVDGLVYLPQFRALLRRGE